MVVRHWFNVVVWCHWINVKPVLMIREIRLLCDVMIHSWKQWHCGAAIFSWQCGLWPTIDTTSTSSFHLSQTGNRGWCTKSSSQGNNLDIWHKSEWSCLSPWNPQMSIYQLTCLPCCNNPSCSIISKLQNSSGFASFREHQVGSLPWQGCAGEDCSLRQMFTMSFHI